MRFFLYLYITFILQNASCNKTANSRQRRYLLFTQSTQFGALLTVAIPLHPETLVSVAWFIEANYYNVDNVTYFDPLLGDIETVSRRERSLDGMNKLLTRTRFYQFIETMLEKHGHPGQPCLFRLICENAHLQFLDNGLIGDLFRLVLTPSSSMYEDDLLDSYYEAEYRGLDEDCDLYSKECPEDPLASFSVFL